MDSVCWDEDLIPARTVNPYGYEASKTEEKSNITQKDIIVNFAKYDAFIVGRIHGCFTYWADRKGICLLNILCRMYFAGSACKECQELNTIFARAIDSAKSGEVVRIPSSLRPTAEQKAVPAPKRFVWQFLSENAEALQKELQEAHVKEIQVRILQCNLGRNQLILFADRRIF